MTEKIIRINGKRVKELREEYHLSQLVFSELIRISRQTISEIEKGWYNIKEENLQKLINFGNRPRLKGGFTTNRIRRINKAYFLK